MATKIITKNSSTATSIPTAGDLVQGELAVNVTDKRLFTEDSGGAIVELGTNPSTIDINAGTIDGTTIGATTPASVAATTLSTTGAATFGGSVNAGAISSFAGGLYVNATDQLWLDSGGDSYLQEVSSNIIRVVAASNEVVRFDGNTLGATFSGDVGIGGAPLANNQLLLTDAGTYSQFHMQNSTSGSGASDGFRILMDGVNTTITNHETGYMAFETQNTERLRIDSAGAATFSGTVTANSNVFVTGAGANGTRLDLEASNTAASIIANYGVSAVPLDFYTGALKRMTLDASGNLTLKNTNNIANITTAAITLTGAGGGGTGGQTVNIATTAYVGVLSIGTTQGVSALYYINGVSATQVVVQNAVDARFSNTSGSGNTVNIYVSGSDIVLENNIQATRSFYITFMGKF